MARTALVAIFIAAAFVRVWQLSSIPPGLWYDEAIYALDALTIGNGNWPIFFTTENHMREPLYIYSLAGFFALFGVSTLKARLVGAIWGIATVAIFYPFARRVFPTWWAVAATAAFSVFRWHVHFSRSVFRALTPPFFVLGAAWFFSRWFERRKWYDAMLCGFFIGAAQYTYLSMRFLPLIFLCWMGWLLMRRQLNLRRDWRGLSIIWSVAAFTFLPLGLDYLHHPEHFSGRTGEISMLEKTVQTPSGEQRVSKTAFEVTRDLSSNALDVLKMWTIRGDHVAKHNFPFEPVFDWISGVFFYLGIGWCVANLLRNQYAFLLLVWLFFMSLTSVFSFGAPNLLRMQGASPAAVIVYMIGLKAAYEFSCMRYPGKFGMAKIVAVSLLVFFAAWQLGVYFLKFPKSAAAHVEFLKETFYEPAEAVAQISPTVDRVLVPAEMAYHPTFRFVTHGFTNVVPYAPEAQDFATTHARTALLVSIRARELATPASREALAAVIAAPRTVPVRRFEALLLERQDQLIDAETAAIPWAELYLVSPR